MTGDADHNPVHEFYHAGLRNMHALEMSAIELTQRQLERLESYPEMAARLRQHNTESKQQAERLEAIMQRHGIGVSHTKNTAASVMGNMAAALHTTASDEILKNTFANFAFEHQEMASYTSLIAMATKLGDTQSVPPLQQSLSEEESMAKFIGDQIVPTTHRFMDLTQAGQKAGV